MKRLPAFQFYPQDWLSSASISLMTPAEEGAYIRLLALAWLEPDCGLPDDDAVLARLSRLKGAWARGSGAKLRGQFRAEGGRLFNERLLRARDDWLDYAAERAEAGRRGGLERVRRAAEHQASGEECEAQLKLSSSSAQAQLKLSSSSAQAQLKPSASAVASATEENSPPTPSLVENKPPPGDDAAASFEVFRREAEAAGMSGSGPDWDEALLEWRRLDWDQRQAARVGIQARAGRADSPELASLPKNYLGRWMWERKVRQAVKSKREALWEQV
jgi:uncharacterized protein YdaU (DUF1376 family)